MAGRGAFLIYGQPALLIVGGVRELLASVLGYERATVEYLRVARSQHAQRNLTDELKLCTLLHAGLTQLAALNGATDAKQLTPSPNPSCAEGGEAVAGTLAAEARSANGGEPSGELL